MKSCTIHIFAILILIQVAYGGVKKSITPFFNFTVSGDAGYPVGSDLLVIGEFIYGISEVGGSHGEGTLFRIRKDGSGYQILYNFGLKSIMPAGRLVYDGERLYGTTNFSVNGGPAPGGTVFSIKPDGSDFTILKDFYSIRADYHLWAPYMNVSWSGIILVDGILYGTALGGSGSVFSVRTDGTDFKVLYNFPSDESHGAVCFSGLTHNDGTLYGCMVDGGAYGGGTLFSIQCDGSDFKVVHHIGKTYPEGGVPYGPVLIDSNTIYGTCTEGGLGYGTVFSIKKDGAEFTVLHKFGNSSPQRSCDITGFSEIKVRSESVSDGSVPGVRGLLLIDDYLYGCTVQEGLDSGREGTGTLFRIRRSGKDFEVLDTFNDAKGKYVKSRPAFIPPYIYGSADEGGLEDYGTLWKYYAGYPASVITYEPETKLTVAKLWGNAWEDNDKAILEKGFCWGLSADPDHNDEYKVVGTGPGKFVTDIYQLMPGKTYYVRAFARTEMGVFFGKSVAFRSPHPKISGTVTMDGKPVAGVLVDFVGREQLLTDSNGRFFTEVYYGWSGRIELSRSGYIFSSASCTLANVRDDQALAFTCTKE